MSITVGRYTFDGPYNTADMLEDRSGVYAIHCRTTNGYFLMDVGESAMVKMRVENHERKACGRRTAKAR